jgi:class 3 adenylate cyclase/predicted ATPase
MHYGYEKNLKILEAIKQELQNLHQILPPHPDQAPLKQLDMQIGLLQQQMERQSLLIDILQRYIPEGVVDRIVDNPEGVTVYGERRQVTVMFADVSGFTAMSEKLDAEQVVNVINALFTDMIEIIYKYSGMLNKFMGDALLVIFGAPRAHDDDPIRAVRCALEMQESIAKFSERWGFPFLKAGDLSMSIGINSGLVVAGNVGSSRRMEYTVMGDTVNTSSRLESIANRGEIIINDSTYRRVQGIFQFTELPPAKVKGKSEKLRIYRVDSLLAGEHTVAMKHFFGRRSELNLFEHLLANLARAEGQTVVIQGEAGVGKTILLQRVKGMVLEQKTSVRFLFGECHSYTSTILYYPLISIVRELFSLHQISTSAEVLSSIRKRLKLLGMDEEDIIIALPFFNTLLSLNDAETPQFVSQNKNLIFKFLIHFFSLESRREPLFVAIDDFQWADSSSLEFFASLAQNIADLPIILTLTCRDDFSLPWMKGAHTQHLPLQNFSRSESLAFIDALLRDEADLSESQRERIIEKIYAKSQGHPLFIEEAIRIVRDKNLLTKKIAPGQEIELEIPDSIHTAMMSRFDLMPERHRVILQYAAVIGRNFSRTIIEQITDMAGAKVMDSIHEILGQYDVLLRNQSGAETSYTFRYNIFYDVVYSSILIERRKEIHAKAARMLEQTYREQISSQVELIAYHYSRSNDSARAIYYLQQAGNKADNLFAYNESLQALEKALEIIEQAPDRQKFQNEKIDILLQMGKDLGIIGERKKAVECCLTALNIGKSIESHEKSARAYMELGTFHILAGQWTEALACFQESLSFYRQRGDSKGLAVVYKYLGNVYLQQGNMAQAEENYLRGLDYADLAHDRETGATINMNLGILNNIVGRKEHALFYYMDSAIQYEKIGDLRGLAKVYHNMAMTYAHQGDTNSAIESFDKCLEISKKIGEIGLISINYLSRAEIYIKLADFDLASAYCDKAINVLEKLDDRLGMAEAYKFNGTIFSQKREWERADFFFQRSIEINRSLNHPLNLAESLEEYGYKFEKQGKPVEAIRELQDAAGIYEKIKAMDVLEKVRQRIVEIEQRQQA